MRSPAFVVAAFLALAPSAAHAVTEPAWTWTPASSSNYRRSGARRPDRIVIHKSEGSFQSCVSWFRNPSSRVSAHWVVAKDGRIAHMVDDRDVAWHAGSYNTRSIGIENEGWTYRDDTSDAHYRKLAQLTAWLCKKHAIPADRTHIVGHVQVPGASHTDPGPYWDWSRFMRYVQAELGGTAAPVAAPPAAVRPTPPPAPRPVGQARAVQVDPSIDGLNVRTSAWGTVIGTASPGDSFVLTGNQANGFREVWWGGRRAWLSAGYLRAAGGLGARVNASALNARDNPVVSNNVIGIVHAGEVYCDFTSRSQASWRLVSYGPSHAWIYRSYTSDVSLSP